MRKEMTSMIRRIQEEICEVVGSLDNSEYREDVWNREEGGGGRSRVFSGGSVFEKAGINISEVYGSLSEEASSDLTGGSIPEGIERQFFATGISLVLHPRNPMAPTVHANYRYFERGDGTEPGSWWFGGGADLTPSYLFKEDSIHFHGSYKDICDRHEVADYGKFKMNCDQYFFIKHRKEHRGVGGIFFDGLNEMSKDACFLFVKDCAEGFINSYLPIISRRKDMEFESKNKDWQRIRRGRYVEFNLVYDRGTKFGLNTNGRIESILMSLPEVASWKYCHEPDVGSSEQEMLDVLRSPIDWA
tara:strand:+ start:5404 stop:6309 length:906 start_codon:yes stop_codon:yes gene_type:complete